MRFTLMDTVVMHTVKKQTTCWFAVCRDRRCGNSKQSASGVLLALACLSALALAAADACAQPLFDESVRAEMLKHRDGRIAHLETEYNDIFVDKRGPLLALSTRYRSESYLESKVNLKDPDELPVEYSQLMPAGLLYPQTIKRVLMVGLGAGSVSTYIGRAMPDLQIDVVELDPGVVTAAKKYFGLQDTDKVHIIEGDGRVYLNRHKEPYDLILLDAYRQLGVPFHLLTKEFYTLVKERLSPGGAVTINLLGGTKLYLSAFVTMHAVFPTVDVYPVGGTREETQVVMVATAEAAPSTEALARRAMDLQSEHHFRYPLPGVVAKRVENLNPTGVEVLTDDFAPVGLYEVTPVGRRNR
jgi:spermidine synthase